MHTVDGGGGGGSKTYRQHIDDIPKIDFPVLTRIRGLFIGPWRTAVRRLNTGK